MKLDLFVKCSNGWLERFLMRINSTFELKVLPVLKLSLMDEKIEVNGSSCVSTLEWMLTYLSNSCHILSVPCYKYVVDSAQCHLCCAHFIYLMKKYTLLHNSRRFSTIFTASKYYVIQTHKRNYQMQFDDWIGYQAIRDTH